MKPESFASSSVRRAQVAARYLAQLSIPCYLLLTSHVQAQENPESTESIKPSWFITPSISGGLTLTDNAHPGQGKQQGDLITSVTPAIRIDGKGGRISGNLNFSWQQNLYARESRFNDDQKSLAAAGKAELIDQWLFLDASANIAQTPISVFGTQGVGNELAIGNRSESRSFQWSPYIQGYLKGNLGYELRYRNMMTKSNSGTYALGSGVDTQAWSGRLWGGTPLSRLGWSLAAEDQRFSFDSRNTKSNRVFGTLEYNADPQLKINVSGGTESDDYTNFEYRRRTIHGYGLDWAPTERTLLTLKKESRSFGDGHTIDFSHRTAQTAWKISDTREVVIPAQQFATAVVSTAYDLLFLQLASSIPDPVARALVVSQLLQQAGIPSNSPIYGNIMSSQPFIQRRQQASVSLTGVNNTVTFSLHRSRSNRIGTGIGSLDDFALSENIRQSGFSGSWAYKLSPVSNLTLNAVSTRSQGETATLDSSLRSYSLLYTTKLGAKTTASVGVRQNQYEGSDAGLSDYTENALLGTLSTTF